MEFLGGIYDTDNSGKLTLEWLQTVQCIKSAASKVSLITMSTLHSLVYQAINSVLGHEELESVDKTIDNSLIASTKNIFSYPRKLLQMSRTYWELGISSFSYLAESRKLQRLFFSMFSKQMHGLAARGILSRAARNYGIYSSPGQKVLLFPSRKSQSTRQLCCDGPITLLTRCGFIFADTDTPRR